MSRTERRAPGAPLADGEGIPLCVPEIRGNEWKYVKDCLDTNWVSSGGSYVERFEGMLAAASGCAHAVATVNGTAALHVALRVAGVDAGDEVLVSSLTFIAPANAIRYVGARPVFIDAEPTYWQMDPQRVVDYLERECRWKRGELRNRTTGARVRAILPVHVLGHPVDLEPIVAAAKKYGLAVVEDATESLGARLRGEPVGHLGDVACFSFNGNKIVTTGGGGMIVTDDAAWASRARYLTTQAKDDPIEYVHREVGYNYRLTNIQAAMGVAQMEQLPAYVAAKRRIAAGYAAAFASVPGLTVMREAPWAESTFWMYTVLVDEGAFGTSARGALAALDRRKIQARPLWQPIHLSPAHADVSPARCEVAERLHRDGLTLPCSVGLTEEQQARVIGEIRALASAAGSRAAGAARA